MAEIIVAKHAGFCFGVKRATDVAEKMAKEKSGDTKIYTLGRLIHNDGYVAELKQRGVGELSQADIPAVCERAKGGEKITVIFVNNAIYGMTGGQMAPTTLIGQKSTTSPLGRSKEVNGNPIRMSEMLSTLDGPAYIERVSLHDVKNVMNAKKAIKKAFEYQMAGKGFTMIEALSTCPTNWGLTPVEALKWLENNMLPQYPLGVFKDIDA